MSFSVRICFWILIIKAKIPFFLTIGLIYFISLVYAVTFLLEEFEKPEVKVLTLVMGVLFLLINVSFFRASFTEAGHVTKIYEWDINEKLLENYSAGAATKKEIINKISNIKRK